jgi:acyl-CoA thioesterase I
MTTGKKILVVAGEDTGHGRAPRLVFPPTGTGKRPIPARRLVSSQTGTGEVCRIFTTRIRKHLISAPRLVSSPTGRGEVCRIFTACIRKNLIPSCLLLTLFLGIVSCNNNSTDSTHKKQEEVANKPLDTLNKKKTILFFGNSLTAGYGVDPAEAYPALIQDKIDSLHLNYKVVNAGVSGETTSSGNSRIDWILKQPVDIFVLELGANDGLRGIPLPVTEKNLQSIIDKVKAKYPPAKIILEGMQIPPNMGPDYTAEFKEIYPRLASKNKIELIPFLLKNVGGDPKLNQRDGIHPTAEGHKIVAENVWEVLKKDL